MDKISHILNLFVGAAAVALVCPAAATAKAASADLQTAMKDYQRKDYSGAIANLVKADQRDPLVRYYLGLSYQGVGNFQDAQKQYTWTYSHARSADIKTKAWQGMQALAAMNRTRQMVVETDISKTAPVAVQAVSSPSQATTALSNLDNRYFKSTFRPGCPNH
jgi:tetratricopeptide (TPR) repeat protein